MTCTRRREYLKRYPAAFSPFLFPAVGRYRNFSRGCPRTRVPAPRFRSMPASLFFELTFHGSELREDSMRQLLLCSIVRHALGYGYSECVVWRTRVRENDRVYAVVLNRWYKRKIQRDAMNRSKTKIEEEKIALEASLLPLAEVLIILVRTLRKWHKPTIVYKCYEKYYCKGTYSWSS